MSAVGRTRFPFPLAGAGARLGAVLVRPMTEADCALLDAVFAEVPGGVEPRQELTRDLTRAWVGCAALGEPPLGYALVWHIVDEFQLLGLGTLPSARRRGVARALLGEVLRAARAAGAERVTLEVAEGNLAARRLYEDAGFSVFNVRRAYYRKSGEDALEMELSVASPRA